LGNSGTPREITKYKKKKQEGERTGDASRKKRLDPWFVLAVFGGKKKKRAGNKKTPMRRNRQNKPTPTKSILGGRVNLRSKMKKNGGMEGEILPETTTTRGGHTMKKSKGVLMIRKLGCGEKKP